MQHFIKHFFHALTVSLATVAGTTLGAALATSPVQAQSQTEDPTLEGEILLRLTSSTALPTLLTTYELQEIDQFGSRPIYRVLVTGASTVDDTVDALILEPDVLAAEPHPVMESPEARKNAAWAVGEESEYTAQWAPAAIRLGVAHSLSKGRGVRVALLDTGVDPLHPGLDGRLIPGWDFVDNDNDSSEVGNVENAGFGHGTHVAGIVTLVAPESRIMPLRVLDAEGMGNVWTIAEAILFAVDPDLNPVTNDGARVINLSLGTLERSDILRNAVELATCTGLSPIAGAALPQGQVNLQMKDPGYDNDRWRCRRFGGAVVVAASGNDATDNIRQYPAGAGTYGMLSVGASDAAGGLANFSNFGSWVDILAPGADVTSFIPGGIYGTWSGTSMAAPFVTGTAALLLAKHPRLEPRQVARRIERTSRELCGTDIGQIDAAAVLGENGAGGTPCP